MEPLIPPIDAVSVLGLPPVVVPPPSSGLLLHSSLPPNHIPPRSGSLSPIPRVGSSARPDPLSFSHMAQKGVSLQEGSSSLALTSFLDNPNITGNLITPKVRYEVNGIPAVRFNCAEISELSKPFDLSLVGKFMAKTPPKISEIALDFKKFKLKAGFNVSFIGSRHIIIKLFLEEDFTKLWLKSSLFIAGSALSLAKWSPSYTPELDSPIVPC